MTKPIIIREECLTDYLEFRLYWIEESLAEYKKNPLAYNSYVQELSSSGKSLRWTDLWLMAGRQSARGKAECQTVSFYPAVDLICKVSASPGFGWLSTA